MLFPEDFFDMEGYEHRELFQSGLPVWTALDRLPSYISSFFNNPCPLSNYAGAVEQPLVITGLSVRSDLSIRAGENNVLQAFEGDCLVENAAIIMPGAYLFDSRIIIGPGTVIEPGALIKGPTVIGSFTEIRQGAYLRGKCLIGNHCVVGHTTEVKGSIMMDGAKAGHFAYIGDSILGKNVNLGAGTKLANLKIVPGAITVAVNRKFHKTNRRKLGAILGDRTETGCNAVASPGTLMERDSVVFPGTAVPGGYYLRRTHVKPSPVLVQTGVTIT